MSSKDAFNVAKQLCESGCPTEILGSNPMIVTDEDKCNIEENFSNLLFRPSHERNELLKWMDSKIFYTSNENGHDYVDQKHVSLDTTSIIKERLSCIMSDTSDGFFGATTQVYTKHLFV